MQLYRAASPRNRNQSAAEYAFDLVEAGADAFDAIAEACVLFNVPRDSAHHVERRIARLQGK
jgi:hypothetical protein